MTIQNAGATTPSEKFSAKLSITARGDTAVLERLRHACDVHEQAALGEECAGKDSDSDQPKRQKEQALLDEECHQADNAEKRKHRHGPCPAARLGVRAVAVQALVEPADETAHPGDGMADRTRQPVRIADRELDQQSKKRERRGHGTSPRSCAACPWRRPRCGPEALSRRA